MEGCHRSTQQHCAELAEDFIMSHHRPNIYHIAIAIQHRNSEEHRKSETPKDRGRQNTSNPVSDVSDCRCL